MFLSLVVKYVAGHTQRSEQDTGTNIVRYDGKDRRKYRNKVRASKRWLQRRNKKEAEEMNSRERKRRTRKTQDQDRRRI
eukprot:4685256-Pleurochrysis_carterae.AAC.4